MRSPMESGADRLLLLEAGFHGMVDRPVMLTVEEIRRLPAVLRIYFIDCEGNTTRA